jgi:hypothetical protein
MSVLTTFAGTGAAGYAPGDNLRVVTTALTSSDTTVLNVSSTKGIVLGIQYLYTRNSGDASSDVTTLKVTVDGAAERTLISGTTFIRFRFSTTTYFNTNFYLPLNLPFDSSCVIKTNSSDGLTNAIVFYGIRN